MSSLRELQTGFVSALFGELPDSGVAAMAIYRNNLREGFIKALALEFPVVERLVGQDYFRQLGGEFLLAHPSRAGDLHAIGAPFPEYLRERYAVSDYAYLPDVAALEWAYQQASIAADAPAFDVQSLACVAPELYGGLRFNLHPACFLVHSMYPILRIWQVNQTDNTDTVDLSAGADHIITRRVGDGIELRRLAPTEYVLLEGFSQGATLAEALAAVQVLESGFDLGRALRQAIALGLITAPPTDTLFLTKGILP